MSTLGITGVIPLWLVILVVSRDIMIVGAIMLSWVVDRPVAIRPLHGVQAQHRGADRVRRPGAGVARLRFRRRAGVDTGDGAGRGLDLAFGRPLSRRMGAAHELGGRPSRDACGARSRPSVERVDDASSGRSRSGSWRSPCSSRCSGCCSDILLPFVAGMALAYLLDPVADRLERLGISRACWRRF